MKIVLVHNRYQRPGGEDVVFEQERQLLERHGNTVATYCRSNMEVDSYSGIGRLVLVKHTVWASDTHRDFAELLRRERPDVVHIHNTFVMVSPSIYGACVDAGVPVVQTLHNYRLFCPAGTFFRQGKVCEECVDYGLQQSLIHGCYRESRPATAAVSLMMAVHRLRDTWNRSIDSYIALSEFSRDTFIKAGLPAGKVVVKPNFVHPDPGLRAHNSGYALFMGRLSP
jgi:glycosyltransferase involved in cell wall biosynthesis